MGMSKKLALCVVLSVFTGSAWGQNIVVTSPAGGDTWRIGEDHTITWTKTGAMDDEVKILLFQSGERVLEIAGRVPNSGRCPWLIPDTVVPGRYTVRVRTIDTAVADNSEGFAIEAAAAQPSPPPAQGPLTLVAPNGKEEIRVGDTFRITWRAVAGGGAADRTVDLFLYREGRAVGAIKENLPLMQRSFDWIAGRLLGGTAGPDRGYTVRIRVDGTTVEDESDRAFILLPGGGAAGGAAAGGDLELVDLENSGNKVAARIRSTFPRFAGSVMYEMRRPSWAPTPVFRYPLNMLFEEPGEKVYIMENIVPSRPTDADFCASTYEMFLDITNLVEESNELNNHKAARLYGNPTFVVVERVWWGGEDIFRGGTLRMRSGEIVRWGNGSVRSVNQSLIVLLRNCGHDGIRSGELRVSQTGVLSGDRPGMSPTYRTKELLHTPMALPALGRDQRRQTLEIAFDPSPSEIRVEFIWEDEGLHTDLAVFTFNVDFRDLL
jgi:hypothetical protein